MTAVELRRVVEAAARMRSYDWLEVRDLARACLTAPAPVAVAGQLTFGDTQ